MRGATLWALGNRAHQCIEATLPGVLFLTLLGVVFVRPAWAQQPDHHWGLDVVGFGYDAGDHPNCSAGYGLGVDVESSFGGRVRLGGLLGVRVPMSLQCHEMLIVRQIDGRTFAEDGRIELGPAPVLAASIGVASAGVPTVIANFRAGAASGFIGDLPRRYRILPLGQAELVVRGARLQLVARIGAFRAPSYFVDGPIVITEWHWRRWFEGGVGVNF